MNNLTTEFSTKKVKQPNGDEKDVEFVSLSGGYLGKDVVVREVTDAERLQFATEYEAFKNPPPPPEDNDAKIAAKDAEIAALKAELAKAKGA